MDLPQGLTLASIGAIALAVLVALVGSAIGGWIGLGLAVVFYSLMALASLLVATSVLVNARSPRQPVYPGLIGTRAAIGLTMILALLLVGFAVFAAVPAAWRVLAATVAFVDAIAVTIGMRALDGARVASGP